MEKIINANLIDLELEAVSKDGAIECMAALLEKNGRLSNKAKFVEVVKKREAASSTGIGLGLAIPHGKSDTVKMPTVAFAKNKAGIAWQTMDGEPVYMVFLIAVPQEAASNQHLKILALLSRKLMHEDFRNKLLKTEDKNAVLAILEEVLTGVDSVA